MPPPVARYLKQSLGDTPRTISTARLRQRGSLRTDATRDRWLDFTAREIISVSAMNYQWDARVSIAPLLHIRVLDSYQSGHACGRVRLLSVITLTEDSGGAELELGSLLRFIAESPWYPTALLPSASLEWRRIDDSRALAVVASRGLRAELEFRFNAAGDIQGVYARSRPRRVERKYEMTPWEGHFSDYSEHDGLRIPFSGEVGWYINGSWRCVWRGHIEAAEYEFAPA
jgi:hypothetical protein